VGRRGGKAGSGASELPPEGAGRRPAVDIATAVAVIAVVGVIYWVLQFATDSIIGTDGYFHIKFSYLMSHGYGLIRRLPWLYFTIHRDYYRDHHFLQHVLYIPFTFGDLRLGAKLAAWLFGTLAVAVFYLVAARRGKAVAVIMTLVLMGSSIRFLTRTMMPRVTSMSLLALMARRRRWLAGIMFGYVWLYDGFILGVFAILCFFVAGLAVERRADWRTLAWGLGGVVAAVVINPYFPHNIGSYLFNLQRSAGEAQLIKGTGWEWRPFDSWYLLRSTRAVWMAFGLGLTLAALCRRPRRETLGLLLMGLLGAALAMKARRHVAIFAPLALLFVAYAWSDFWQEQQERSPGGLRRWRLAATAALAGLVVFTPFTLREQWQRMRNERAFAYYRGAAEYLRLHADPKTIVFNTDWDDFPYLFFFNSQNYYVVGLDQLYMKRFDERLFNLWNAVREGKVENPSQVIQQEFGAEYVVVDVAGKGRLPFIFRADSDGRMRRVYEDQYCLVYRIVPSL